MIYLDNAANTYVFPEVLDAMLPWFRPDHVGNPSSIHFPGVKARKAVEKARRQVADMIGANPSEIFFTSGGTESNNAWLKCVEQRWCAPNPIVITTEIEHSSVLEPIKASGYGVKYVKVHYDGSIDLECLEQVLLSHRGISGAVSLMWVNNELGTVNPIKEIGMLCKKYGFLFHSDAVQAAGHVSINVKDCGVDFLSLSGHKFGAPLGVGVLYVNSAVRKHSLIAGGGQESGMRGGTENVPGIVGLGKAAEIVTERLPEWRLRWSKLRNTFLTNLSGLLGEFYINGGAENYSSSIISLTIPGVNSESLLLLLDQQGVCLSAGSACSASSAELSHVLKGIGMSDEDAACTVRISMGFDTSYTDMIRAAQAIAETVQRLKSMYP